MADQVTIPNVFVNTTGDQPASDLDENFAVLRDFVNVRVVGFGTLATRPAAGNKGAIYVASDQNNAIYIDNGSAWVQVTFPTGGATTVGLILGLPNWIPRL